MNRDLDPVEARLAEWAEWMREGESLAESFPSKSPCFISSWIKDREELFDNNECQQVAAIGACIDSLPIAMKRIIYYFHELGYSTWRFENPMEAYQNAIEELKPMLRNRCLIN